MDRRFFLLGSLLAFLAVAAGAFGGHVLKARLSPELFDIYLVATRYHMYHALALLATAWAATRWPTPWPTRAGYAFTLGILLFSGSLYLLSLTNQRWLGALTPLGGVSFLLGWLSLFLAAWRSKQN